MTRTHAVLALLATALLFAGAAFGGVVRETWGKKAIHSEALTVVAQPGGARIVFDLKAIPKDAKVYRALLRNEKIDQPAQPVRIFALMALPEGQEPKLADKPLVLLPPRCQWFDATEAVQRWVANPQANHGLSLAQAAGFAPETAFLDVWYQAEPKDPPPGVTDIQALHHDGQTFLTWQELPMYRPEAAEVVWAQYDKRPWRIMDGPGEGYLGRPRVAGILQKTLRKLQRYEVINSTTNSMSRTPPKLVRKGAWPDVSYRVYRSSKPITPETIADAEWIGDIRPLSGYDHSMIRIETWGEYYDPRENPEAFIPTYCLADGESLPPGRAFHVSTTTEPGAWYYAVTVSQDGVESFAVAPGQGSLKEPVAETPAPLKPVLQYPSVAWDCISFKYYLWEGPPLTNLARAGLNRIAIYVSPKHQEAAPKRDEALPATAWLSLVKLVPAKMYDDKQVMLGMDFGNALGYSQGRGSFLSLAESKMDYYYERTWTRMIDWACQQWRVDPGHGVVAEGHYVPPLYPVRHGDRIKFIKTQPWALGYDWVWRPGSCPLGSLVGPRASAVTTDGLPAWDVWHLEYYLRSDPARDLPFCHWIEQQEGPAISFLPVAAMRDARQPFACEWGGGRLSSQLSGMLRMLRWDKPVPAFGHCSLDANPGAGWRPDGDPKGQINGFLIWDYAGVTESAEAWEMSVGLTLDAPRGDCTVNLTPRHCKLFKPKPGEKLAWANTDAQGKSIQTGDVTADQWGLVTLKDLKVLKGAPTANKQAPCDNRIRISRSK